MLPVAAVRVLGVWRGEPGRQFLVERVGQVSDVAQRRRLSGTLRERVLLQAVLGDRPGSRDSALKDLVAWDQFVDHAEPVGPLAGPPSTASDDAVGGDWEGPGHVLPERAVPPMNADERSTMAGWLGFYRATPADECAGLDEVQARSAAVPQRP